MIETTDMLGDDATWGADGLPVKPGATVEHITSHKIGLVRSINPPLCDVLWRGLEHQGSTRPFISRLRTVER